MSPVARNVSRWRLSNSLARAAVAAVPFLHSKALTLVVLAGTFLCAAPLHSQNSAALSAQRQFEQIRLRNLPYGPSGKPAARCDEIIGRFCYEFGDRSEQSITIPDEPTEVVRAREQLILTLDSLSRAEPADEWTVGSLVRYAVEGGDSQRALRLAESCRASAWWCLALQGYAYHAQHQPVRASSSFERARALMDSATLCAWDNISWLLSLDERESYSAQSCTSRVELNKQFWWLADPLFAVPGNERRNEHDSRRVLERLAEKGVNPTWLRWDDDLSELLVRFGWPSHWRRFVKPMLDPNASQIQISQYHREPSYHFAPTLSGASAPTRASPGDWSLWPEPSVEEYSPHGVLFRRADQQLARFLRGDSLLVVAAIQPETAPQTGATSPSDSPSPNSAPFSVGAFSASSASAPIDTLTQFRSSATTFRFSAQTANVDQVVSIELSSSVPSVAGDSDSATDSLFIVSRARAGFEFVRRNSAGQGVSDFLLLEVPEDADLPTSLTGAIPLARSSHEISAGSEVALFWEVYGVARGDQLQLSVSAVPEDRPGLLRRMAEGLRLVSPRGTVEVSWPDGAEETARILPRAVRLDMQSLRPGEYTLLLEVIVNSGEPLTRSRQITVR